MTFDLFKMNMISYIYEIYGIDASRKCFVFTNFSVHYGYFHDQKLDEHVDDSDITVNICLKNTQNFTGLKFNQTPDTLFSFKHNKPILVDMEEGDVLIHSGKQPHEVCQKVVNSENKFGERVNLVIWLKFKN